MADLSTNSTQNVNNSSSNNLKSVTLNTNNEEYEDDDYNRDIEAMMQQLRLLNEKKRIDIEDDQKTMLYNEESLEQLKEEKNELKQQLEKLNREKTSGKGHQQSQIDKLEAKVTKKKREADDMKNKHIDLEGQLIGLHDQLKELGILSKPHLEKGSSIYQEIRILENRLDKAMIKYNEALSIRRTYEQISKRLQQDRLGFDNQLQAMERTFKAKERDYHELVQLSHNASKLKEQAKTEFDREQAKFDEMQRQKEKELQEKKKFVQAKLDFTANLSKREQQRVKDEKENSDKLKQQAVAMLLGGKSNKSKLEEEKTKFFSAEKKWQELREVTGANNESEVINKFLSISDTQENLHQLSQEAQKKIEVLTNKKKTFKEKLEKMQFSTGSSVGSRRIIDEFEQQLTQSTANMKRNKQKFERVESILNNVKAGVVHLNDKIKHFKIEGAATPQAAAGPEQQAEAVSASEEKKAEEKKQGGDPNDMKKTLDDCAEKLKQLYFNVKDFLKADVTIPVQEDKSQLEDIMDSTSDYLRRRSMIDFSSLDGNIVSISKNNIRIKLEEEKQKDEDEDDSAEEDEFEGDVLDRTQVKNLAQNLVEKNENVKKKKKKF